MTAESQALERRCSLCQGPQALVHPRFYEARVVYVYACLACGHVEEIGYSTDEGIPTDADVRIAYFEHQNADFSSGAITFGQLIADLQARGQPVPDTLQHALEVAERDRDGTAYLTTLLKQQRAALALNQESET